MQHVLQYYYSITLNKNEIVIYNGTHGTMKSDSGGMIRGFCQRPRVSNVFFCTIFNFAVNIMTLKKKSTFLSTLLGVSLKSVLSVRFHKCR